MKFDFTPANFFAHTATFGVVEEDRIRFITCDIVLDDSEYADASRKFNYKIVIKEFVNSLKLNYSNSWVWTTGVNSLNTIDKWWEMVCEDWAETETFASVIGGVEYDNDESSAIHKILDQFDFDHFCGEVGFYAAMKKYWNEKYAFEMSNVDNKIDLFA